MRIKFIEIQNFRKLKSIRVDLNERITLCVGANNSGKTSAMVALSYFLLNPKRFSTNDFTLSNWTQINKIGSDWEKNQSAGIELDTSMLQWQTAIPTLDLWLEVEANEIHHVRGLIPILDWTGGALGVRLSYQPEEINELAKEYLSAIKAANTTKELGNKGKKTDQQYKINLWPSNLRTFLERKLSSLFSISYYLLDPSKCVAPKNGIAQPQTTPAESDPLESDPLKGLIQINEISAQRGLGHLGGDKSESESSGSSLVKDKRKLSEQLKSYYIRHLDPYEYPEIADLEALQALETAQEAYNKRLNEGFTEPIKELQNMNYPTITDPKLKIATRILPTDGLNHSAAVQYDVASKKEAAGVDLQTLPEEYNGLGYQNLISMVFKLMSFRDSWMRVGKAAKAYDVKEHSHPPLHLVLLEEPEAYLHAQVQQVFLRKAYDVLRNHKDLKKSKELNTQLIVSTHSSHIAYESDFSCLRYFRRLPSSADEIVPTSAVINLSESFGPDEETRKFANRYLKATHCDLFFADAAILVEGPAERMLIPHFIRNHFEKLNCCYVTLLEIGGSHAHKLRPLIEHLGLLTLVITDLDSADVAGRHPAVFPQRGQKQITRNMSLKEWHPCKTSIDDLLDIPNSGKEKLYPEIPWFSIRIAYQVPTKFSNGAATSEVLSSTFEDALVFENIELFKKIEDCDTAEKFKEAVNGITDPKKLSEECFQIIKSLDKGAFALDLLWLKDPKDLTVPTYIREGLQWLQDKLCNEFPA